eukprot:CAMPEP_0181527638 /NCGR_PEP_ID=MMETSP1110-20121109/70107_1 /TAXON_ID=174948 /ORGANISM="Symbiodinium sp., Strain CCMP421" /LENGTH=82 /DNA_ID=CAMNT_0023658521 /DNA_START=13 /DNA_END=258 /DNA_ORIENTATION=+
MKPLPHPSSVVLGPLEPLEPSLEGPGSPLLMVPSVHSYTGAVVLGGVVVVPQAPQVFAQVAAMRSAVSSAFPSSETVGRLHS